MFEAVLTLNEKIILSGSIPTFLVMTPTEALSDSPLHQISSTNLPFCLAGTLIFFDIVKMKGKALCQRVSQEMKTKWFLFILTVIAFSAGLYGLVEFNQKTEPIEVGVLIIGENRGQKLAGLKQGLDDLGYKKKELTYIVKNAHDDEAKMKRQIVDLLGRDPDIIVTLGGVESTLLKEEVEREDKRIPVVFAGVAAPKGLGLIEDYRSPGGLFTGINNYHTSISIVQNSII